MGSEQKTSENEKKKVSESDEGKKYERVNFSKEEQNTEEKINKNKSGSQKPISTAEKVQENTSSPGTSQKEKLIIEKLKELFDAVEYKIN